MQIKDAMKVLDVSRTTMMAWLDDGTVFPSAEKAGDNPRDPWLIPVDEVERVRLERVAELREQLARISQPAHEYGNGHVVVTSRT